MIKQGSVSKDNPNFVAVFCKDHSSVGLKIMNNDDKDLRSSNIK